MPVMVEVQLDDALNASFEAVCAARGQDKEPVLAELVRRFVDAEQIDALLKDPDLASAYRELASEDLSLANMAFDDYETGLREADRV